MAWFRDLDFNVNGLGSSVKQTMKEQWIIISVLWRVTLDIYTVSMSGFYSDTRKVWPQWNTVFFSLVKLIAVLPTGTKQTIMVTILSNTFWNNIIDTQIHRCSYRPPWQADISRSPIRSRGTRRSREARRPSRARRAWMTPFASWSRFPLFTLRMVKRCWCRAPDQRSPFLRTYSAWYHKYTILPSLRDTSIS